MAEYLGYDDKDLPSRFYRIRYYDIAKEKNKDK